MYWRTNNGGWNKAKGTAEKIHRIDSYDAGEIDGFGELFASADGKTAFVDCDRYTEYADVDREIVALFDGEWRQEIELSRKANGFGGAQVFFLCPTCGKRVRYLYLDGKDHLFKCRVCCRLNYVSQQETRSGSMFYYDKGMEFVGRHLNTLPGFRPDGFSFCNFVPPRPRYMHQSTYNRYLQRFLRYRERHAKRQVEDMMRILRGMGAKL